MKIIWKVTKMLPFEHYDEHGRRHLHIANWYRWCDERCREYPAQLNHQRVQIDLYFPRDRLEDIPFHWNPHAGYLPPNNYPPYQAFYGSNRWSTIFGAYEFEYPHDNSCYIITTAEEGHQNPWGEPITIYSTSSDLYNDHCNRFAYFRGKYWKIIGFMDRRARSTIIWDDPRGMWDDTERFWLFGGVRDITLRRLYPQLFSDRYYASERYEVDWINEGF
jgi:hypothetical protein